MIHRSSIAAANEALLIALPFAIPLSPAAGSILSGAIFVLWAIEGNFKSKFNQIRSNDVALALLAFLALNVIGLLWTEDLRWGLHMLGKYWKLLMAPVFLTIARRDHLKYYLASYVLCHIALVAVSYLGWMGVVHFSSAPPGDPTPLNHISYNVLLAFAVYILLDALLQEKLTIRRRLLFGGLAAAMAADVFLTGGRAGQLGFLGLTVLYFFQLFRGNAAKAIACSAAALLLIVFASYHFSKTFHARVSLIFQNIEDIRTNPATDVGARLVWWSRSFEIIRAHPLFGVGTGDFPREFRKVNSAHGPSVPDSVNPHNNYILVLAQFGPIGLVALLYIFYTQARISLTARSRASNLGAALVVLFLIVMLTESYLMVHHTALMFSFFGAVLYKRYDHAPDVA